MGTATATRELLAPRDDVWTFVSTPGRLADWWPGVFAAHQDPQETLAERLEEVVGVARTGPDDAFAESILDRLYELCQTGADA